MSEHDDRRTAAGGDAPAARRRRRLGFVHGVSDGISVGKASTIGDLLYERSGNLLDMSYIGIYIALWGRFFEENGREPQSVNELAEWVNDRPSRATLSRYAARFRRAFPEYSTPSVLWSIARQQVKGDNAAVVATQIGAVQL